MPITAGLTAEQIAVKAAGIIRTDGWTQKKLRDSEGRHCAVGAAYEAAGLFNRVHESTRVLDGPLGEALTAMQDHIEADPHTWRIEMWNDQPERTAEEVADAWEATAITLRTEVTACHALSV